MQSKPSRPTGVTLIAILVILVGVIGLLLSLAVLALSGLVTNFGAASIGTVGTAIGGIILFFSLIYLVVGWGFLRGKGWAWILGMIFSILSLIGSIGLTAGGQPGGVGGLLIWGPGNLLSNPVPGESILWQRRTAHRPIISFYTPVWAASHDDQLSRLHSTNNEPFKSHFCSPSPGEVYSTVSDRIRVLRILWSTFSRFYIRILAIVSCPNCGSRLAIGQNKCPACGAST